MRALDRKMLRELGQIRTQVIAIVLVIASGIGGFVAMASTWSTLDRARSEYYAHGRFADVFARVVRAPDPVARRIAALPGVEVVETRQVEEVNLEVRGFDEPVRGRIVSLPRRGRPALNDLYLRRGRWVEPGRGNEVLVHEAFAEAHGLQPGDSIRGVLNGRRQDLRVVGIALSPEYVYQIAPGGIFPDDRRYGVLWMGQEAVATAFDSDGAFNDLALRLAADASEPQVVAAVDRLLAPWGGTGAFGRDDQPSHRMLSDELAQLQSQSVIVPAIFLGVAAFLLHLVMGRIVAGQREIIAVLKALGYGTWAVGLHYLKLVAVVCVGGAAVGALLGVILGRALVGAYGPFFRFPALEFHFDLRVMLVGVVLAVVAGVLATVGSVRRVVRLPPAEAMKPPAPTSYRPMIAERLGLAGYLPPASRMVMRRLERNPVRAGLATLGIALSLAIVVVSASLLTSVNALVDVPFRREQVQDLTITFFQSRGPEAMHEVRRLPGVLVAEPTRMAPVRLRVGHRVHETALQGYQAGGQLRRILDVDGERIELPPDGLVLSRELARQLGLRPGDPVEVEFLEGRRRVARAPVSLLLDDLIGLNAYMELSALDRLAGEGPRVTGALVQLDAMQEQALFDAVRDIPAVAGATLRTAALQVFEELQEGTQAYTTTILAVFASVIAVGVVYNTGRIILADSSRELASLRVLGFTRQEISRIFLGELFALVVLSIPLGWALGWLLALLLVQSFPQDLYRLPLQMPLRDVLQGVAVVVAAAGATALVVRRRLDRLDLVGVLKTRE